MIQMRRPLVLVAAALVVLALVVEVGSPVLTRRTLATTASHVAGAAAAEIAARRTPADARAAAVAAARRDGAGVEAFVVEGNRVEVRIDKDAHSYVLHRFKSTQRWYHVTAKASAVARP
jgi:nitrous oxide reductase